MINPYPRNQGLALVLAGAGCVLALVLLAL
jgi:hypothetical protein